MSRGDDLGAGAVPDASAPRVTGEIASLCEHGSMACPDCDGVDDERRVVERVIHGVECYEAWRDERECPHEQEGVE